MTAQEVFQQFVPESAVDYCVELYEQFGFDFKVKKARKSKLGDYRYDLRTGRHTITINNDLNPYAFLITYLHEAAHLTTNKKFGLNVQPHGSEWKQNFREIATPVINEKVFPRDLLTTLHQYFRNPKAASCSDPALHQMLRSYDTPHPDKILLKEVENGAQFLFNKRIFKRMEKKRTRFLCEEVASKKRYLIPEIAEVVRKTER